MPRGVAERGKRPAAVAVVIGEQSIHDDVARRGRHLLVALSRRRDRDEGLSAHAEESEDNVDHEEDRDDHQRILRQRPKKPAHTGGVLCGVRTHTSRDHVFNEVATLLLACHLFLGENKMRRISKSLFTILLAIVGILAVYAVAGRATGCSYGGSQLYGGTGKITCAQR